MEWRNLIVGARSLHNITGAYVNVVNSITTFVEPTTPTNIITHENILTQYSIKQGLQIFWKKGKAAVQKYPQKFHNRIVFEPKKPCNITYEQRKKSLE